MLSSFIMLLLIQTSYHFQDIHILTIQIVMVILQFFINPLKAYARSSLPKYIHIFLSMDFFDTFNGQKNRCVKSTLVGIIINCLLGYIRNIVFIIMRHIFLARAGSSTYVHISLVQPARLARCPSIFIRMMIKTHPFVASRKRQLACSKCDELEHTVRYRRKDLHTVMSEEAAIKMLVFSRNTYFLMYSWCYV